MVSFQSSFSPTEGMILRHNPKESSHKKRKWEHQKDEEADFHPSKGPKLTKEIFSEAAIDVELHLETPLPAEWEQCLDLQSGQIHYYNTRTSKRTSQDPRRSLELPPSSSPPAPMSLELELNLPDRTSPAVPADRNTADEWRNPPENSGESWSQQKNTGGGLSRSLSWVCLAKEDHRDEMEAAVCMRCHMLVMLCKSSPACPNCKFMHPRAGNPLNLFNLSSDLLCFDHGASAVGNRI